MCQEVESLTLYNLASRGGKESLALAFKVAEHYVAHYGVENGVAQELKTLVVDRLPLGVAPGDAAVHERLFVEVDVVWVKSDDVAQRTIKLLFLAERELYLVNEVVNHHIS